LFAVLVGKGIFLLKTKKKRIPLLDFSEKYLILQIDNINDIAFRLVVVLVNIDAKFYKSKKAYEETFVTWCCVVSLYGS
jgi:hypothetical protein